MSTSNDPTTDSHAGSDDPQRADGQAEGTERAATGETADAEAEATQEECPEGQCPEGQCAEGGAQAQEPEQRDSADA